MSHNIPFEIQTEILQRIPYSKSVIRCRSVSKAWQSVIESKEFVTAHALRRQALHHLLIRIRDYKDCETFCDIPVKYVSIVDDDTFPHQYHNVFVPESVNKFSRDSKIVGSCHGLFCLYEHETGTALIWNPFIRKTVAIPIPSVLREMDYWTIFGFGLCPSNLDPKLVKITYVSDWRELRDVNTSTKVEVFTLSSGGTWRSPLSSSNLPHKSICFNSSQAVVDGFIYWSAVDRINVNDRRWNPNLILSFDLTSEEFTIVNLPDSLALDHDVDVSVSNLWESLAILKFNIYTQREICDVWLMTGHGCTRSFNKLYSIHAPDALIRRTLGFRKNGAPIIELANDSDDFFDIEHELAIYEPESKNITHIGIHGFYYKFFVHSYKETLLLLGQQ